MTDSDRTVLVVDDDRTNRSMLSHLLEHEGFRVTLAEDGRAALKLLEGGGFDAVLLDIVMPELDGIEVLRAIKGDVRSWNVPVIMISAVDDVESIVTCLELGADDYVPKPFDPAILRARISACLARRKFHALETEYQRLLAEQAGEIEELRHELDALRGDQV